MVEKRRLRRVPIYLEIKGGDQSPSGVKSLLNISLFGAQLETTTKYRRGDIIEFSYVPPGPPNMAIEIQRDGDSVWTIPAGMFQKELFSGRVVWVSPHPDKTNHFLVGLDLSTKSNRQRRNLLMVVLIIVAIGVAIVILRYSVLYDHILAIYEWFLPHLETMQTTLSELFSS